MHILAHRGYWLAASEKNTAPAFERALEGGFGIETDVRDCAAQLVISHDPPQQPCMPLEQLLQRAAHLSANPGAPLAINIKADGLAGMLRQEMASCPLPWFVFDMSVPDMIQHVKAGNPVFARMSEIEQMVRHAALDGRIAGVWLDGFWSTWYGREVIASLLSQGLKVCAVSPELHGRSEQEAVQFWHEIRPLADNDRLMLCTDWPTQARALLGA